MNPKQPTIVLLGTSLPQYPRNKNTHRALQSMSRLIVLPGSRTYPPYRRQFLWNGFSIIKDLLTLKIPKETNFVFVLFPDHEKVFLAFLYKIFYRRTYKIIFDPLISLYDTYVYNKPLARLHVLKKWLWWYERWLWYMPDVILIDTKAHGHYLTSLLRLPITFQKLPLTADEDRIRPSRLNEPTFWQARPLRVLWYGYVSQMHGMDYILATIQKLINAPIHFTLIGNVKSYEPTIRQVTNQTDQLTYIPDTVTLEEINDHIATHQVCLGVFGLTQKAANVIANKECEALAAGRCLITRQAPKEYLQHGRNCLMADPTDPDALARCLSELFNDYQLCQRLARQGRADYEQYSSTTQLPHLLSQILESTRP